MRTDRLREVADRIELEDRFDYGRFTIGTSYEGSQDADGTCLTVTMVAVPELATCDTAGCVAGWAAHLAYEQGDNAATGEMIDQVAKEWLGLTEDQADNLFYGNTATEWLKGSDETANWSSWRSMSAVEAAKMLRQIADGEIAL